MSGAGSASLEDGHAHEAWRECAQCGLITALPPPRVGFVAYCPRCNYALRRTARSGFHFSIACGMAAMLFYAVALVAPFLEISVYGRIQLARILTGPIQLTDQGFRFVGLLVLAVTIIFPGIKLGIFLVTLIGLETRTIPAGLLKRLFRWYRPISPWAMIDVYLLGFLVAYTRLTVIAEVHLDTALFSLICFMISAAAADGSLDDEEVWEKLDNAPPRAAAPVTAQNLIGCHGCGLLNQAAPGTRCRRCHTVLRARKEESINQSWALMGAAVLLYIPANIYPVMVITQIAREQPFTIMGGISELLAYGLWPLALLVFFASMMIPLVKL
ncbi:MAG TPA: paraquat-inducible protein A, partial [Acidocella sp.]|nr:paraquat-inducible protein A [Acidocella sp.]